MFSIESSRSAGSSFAASLSAPQHATSHATRMPCANLTSSQTSHAMNEYDEPPNLGAFSGSPRLPVHLAHTPSDPCATPIITPSSHTPEIASPTPIQVCRTPQHPADPMLASAITPASHTPEIGSPTLVQVFRTPEHPANPTLASTITPTSHTPRSLPQYWHSIFARPG